ncbi:hypothetical protein AVEN_272499-1 [Araneus ventricosus]|uniref:Uncharacterized protein n=1 Tax=Araneus ventricosus TaxID=182803 RepID=A0A4Y2JYL5_ARAVE|nr:hypothetical protein AVEN_272499-1 [Araneus ventricosus]
MLAGLKHAHKNNYTEVLKVMGYLFLPEDVQQLDVALTQQDVGTTIVVKLRKLPTRAVFEPAHSKIEVQHATTGVESAATELEVLGCSSESPTKAAYKRKVAELGDIIE